MLFGWYNFKVKELGGVCEIWDGSLIKASQLANKCFRLVSKKSLGITLLGLTLLLICTWWFIPPVHQFSKGSVKIDRWRKSFGKVEELVGPSAKGWVPLEQVSLHAVHAILVSEDARFYEHFGLDYKEIWISFLTNVEHRRFIRGASTITQQLVKMAFLSRDKTLVRKLREMFGAVLLEMLFTKEQILEWYLNLVEFGNGVYGINEGASHYFQTNSELLTVSQGVHLALVLPSPNRWSKGLRRRNLTDFGCKRFSLILTKMLSAGYITESQWERAMATGNFGSPVRLESSYSF
ncbi:MAG: transglycosylase domain-containing protein [Oligoflexales bacterium]|nr:transglycosylase domain-containing protein [Oligoflexales bacterium]